MKKFKFSTPKALAHAAIEEYLKYGRLLSVKSGEVSPKIRRLGACFVTVYVAGELRGCIGTHQAFEPLYQNIARNAVEAATADPRFPPLRESELSELRIEVSVLTPLKKLSPMGPNKLLTFLNQHKPGLLLEYQGRRGLFLPQVWRELTSAEDFLSHLCLKAGLPPESWRDKPITLFTFTTRRDL